MSLHLSMPFAVGVLLFFKRDQEARVFAPQHPICCGDMVSIARNGVVPQSFVPRPHPLPYRVR